MCNKSAPFLHKKRVNWALYVYNVFFCFCANVTYKIRQIALLKDAFPAYFFSNHDAEFSPNIMQIIFGANLS